MSKQKIPIKPDEIILDLLVKANECLNHSFYHASKYSHFDKMQSILSLDESIEYLLRIIIYSFDVEANTRKNFDRHGLSELAGEVNKYMKDEFNKNLPYLTEIKLIRQARNQVQHAMMNPNLEFKRLANIAERFFEKCLDDFFGVKKNELKLSSLIKSNEIKMQLQEAENKIEEEDYLQSVILSRNAFENALYHKTLYSNLRFNTVPIRLKNKDADIEFCWLINLIKEKLELIDLGVNTHEYKRFKEYIEYIPPKFAKDSSSYRVLQRKWNKDDAIFCCSFATQTIINWQNQEMEPIETYKLNDKYDSKDKIDNIDITQYKLGSCIYVLGDNNEEIRILVVDGVTKEKLEKLQTNQLYAFNEYGYKNGKINSKFKFKVELKYKECHLLTNAPERWEYSLWLRRIPFTNFHEEYEGGKVVKRTLNINFATSEEIYSTLNEYSKTITRKLSTDIVNYIKTHGNISSEKEFYKIKGLTKEQIESMGLSFTLQ